MKLERGSACTVFAAAGLFLTLSFGSGRPAHAGPIELFYSADVDALTPDEVIAPYQYGGGGMFISQDGGMSFKMLCSSHVDPMVQSSSGTAHILLNAGSIFIPTFGGMWRGEESGCNFALLPELTMYVSDVARDPLNPMRTFAATAAASPAKNGMYVSDASMGGTFTAFGAQEELFIDSLHVVKNGTKRRIYETGVKNDAMTNAVSYSVRVSDDDAQTFASYPYDISRFGPIDTFAVFEIVAVDPTNPDRIIARVKRDMMVDTILESTDQGKTFIQVMELGDAQAITFTPDGKLYLGDNDQDQRKLFVVDSPGAAPRMIGQGWKVGCLQYDAVKSRMFACNDYRFGTVDLATGEFTNRLDMRCATSFIECPGTMPSLQACQTQLVAAYCGFMHYPAAPLCAGYGQDAETVKFIADETYTCQQGLPVNKPDASAGATASAGTGVGATAGMTGGPAAGESASGPAMTTAGAAGQMIAVAGGTTAANAPVQTPKPGGCGCTLVRGQRASSNNSLLGAVLALMATGGARRRLRTRVQRSHSAASARCF